MTRQTCSNPDHAWAEASVQRSSPQGASPTIPFRESVVQVRQRVLQAVQRKDYCRAIAILNRWLASHPGSAADFNNRGLVYLWSGQPRKALNDFNRAIALNPSLASSYNNRANYYITQGARQNALADYDRAIDLDPFHVRARINKAVTLRELGRYRAALDSLDEALAFRTLVGEIYGERGRTYHLIGDWNGAIADYRRALDLLPEVDDTGTGTDHPRHQQIRAWLAQIQSAS